MSIKLLLFSTCLILICACTHTESEKQNRGADALPFTDMELNDLKDFHQTDQGNWIVAGDVYADRKKEHHLQASEGTGILVNQADENNKANLFTSFDHGDMDLELDFMMPKGSNSGVYLQGRYEVQLLDSWLTDSLTFGDCGGIYERWRNDQGYEGKAPSQNASKAPGLWQHLFIRFRAPKFDSSGKKITNAQFDKVVLNGKVIQEQVEVSGPTRAAAFEDEKPQGPLMLQGDHGPVAFKNIRYKIYGDDQIELKNMGFRVYKGMFTNIDTLQYLEPVQTGETDSLSYKLVNENEKYTLVFEGKIAVPQEGEYLFKLQADGPGWLLIDGKSLVDNDAANEYEHIGYNTRNLQEGEHTFKLIYINLVPWRKNLGLSYEGPGIPLTRLTTKSSEPQERSDPPLVVQVENEPVLQRGFINHHDKKKTHTTAVGIPGQVNYAYDLKNHNIISAWRGGFIDVTEMWESRGEKQLEVPLGAELELSGLPAVISLQQQGDSWPDSISLENEAYTNRGYKFQKNGLPVFFYTLNHVKVEDYWYPVQEEKGLTREISFRFNQADQDIYCLVARGDVIEKLPDGSYAIDDQKYYIDALESGSGQPFIRNQKGQYELIVPIIPQHNETLVKYSIIW